MTTGPYSALSPQPCPKRCATAGSSHPKRCFAGLTSNPTGAWATHAARNAFIAHGERLEDARALVRDRGSQFVESFDEIFRTEGLKILKTPVRVPVANTFAERWIGSIRRELLKQPNGLPRTIIWNQHQIERLVHDYIDHHNQHRPHQSLKQRPPTPPTILQSIQRRPSPSYEPADATASSTSTEMPLDHERPTLRAGHPTNP